MINDVYGINKEVATAYVYNWFNNGMGIYATHYDGLIDYIINESEYVNEDLFGVYYDGDMINFAKDIEWEYLEYLIDNEKVHQLINWCKEYYANYLVSEWVDIVAIHCDERPIFLRGFIEEIKEDYLDDDVYNEMIKIHCISNRE